MKKHKNPEAIPSKTEELLFKVVQEYIPERILNYNPQTYHILNQYTGITKSYFACSQDRALAMAYFDQGDQHPLIIVSSKTG